MRVARSLPRGAQLVTFGTCIRYASATRLRFQGVADRGLTRDLLARRSAGASLICSRHQAVQRFADALSRNRCADMCAVSRGPDRHSGATFCTATASAERQFWRGTGRAER
jgi:hypothetical protein